jgi:Flp pilus assembly protein CpaB
MELTQKLVSSRRGSLYVSIAAAVLAGIVILAYLNGYRNNLKAGGTPVTVLVARHTIDKGTAGAVIATKDLYTATTIRESQLREGAFSDPASLTGKVATTTVYKGAQLTAADFSAGVDSPASTLTEHQRIISVPLDAAHGLSGELQEGDHVDVYAAFSVVGIGPNGHAMNGGQSRPILRLIAQNVEVAKIGSNSGVGSSARANSVSLKVSDKQAGNVAFASDNGKVWLSLRPAAGAKPSANPLVSPETLLLGVPPVVVLHALGGRR